MKKIALLTAFLVLFSVMVFAVDSAQPNTVQKQLQPKLNEGPFKDMDSTARDRFNTLRSTELDKFKDFDAQELDKFKNLESGAVKRFGEMKQEKLEQFKTMNTAEIEKFGSMDRTAFNKFENFTGAELDKFKGMKAEALEEFGSIKAEKLEKFKDLKEGQLDKFTDFRADQLSKFGEMKKENIEKFIGFKAETTEKFLDMRREHLTKLEDLHESKLEKLEDLSSDELMAVGNLEESQIEALADLPDEEREMVVARLPKVSAVRKAYWNTREKYLTLRENFLDAKSDFLAAKADFVGLKKDFIAASGDEKEAIKDQMVDMASTALSNRVETIMGQVEAWKEQGNAPEGADTVLTRLEEIKTGLDDGEVTKDDLLDASKAVKTHWIVAQKAIKKKLGHAMKQRIDSAFEKGERFYDKLSTLIGKAEANGKDMAYATEALAEYRAGLDDAAADYEIAKEKWVEADSAAEIGSLMKNAHEYAKRINKRLIHGFQIMKKTIKHYRKVSEGETPTPIEIEPFVEETIVEEPEPTADDTTDAADDTGDTTDDADDDTTDDTTDATDDTTDDTDDTADGTTDDSTDDTVNDANEGTE